MNCDMLHFPLDLNGELSLRNWIPTAFQCYPKIRSDDGQFHCSSTQQDINPLNAAQENAASKLAKSHSTLPIGGSSLLISIPPPPPLTPFEVDGRIEWKNKLRAWRGAWLGSHEIGFGRKGFLAKGVGPRLALVISDLVHLICTLI